MSKENQVLSAAGGKDDNSNEGLEFILRLFVTGALVNSIRAISHLKHICETHIKVRYSLEIIDVYQEKAIAETEQIIALPLLIKTLPLPTRSLIGAMSDEDKVL